MIKFKNFDPGAKIQEKFEADPRDIRLGEVLGTPTDEELVNLPSSVNLGYLIDSTINQSPAPSCTSHAKGHENLIRQAIDYGSLDIKVYPKEFRVDIMGHKNISNEVGDTLENNLKNEHKYGFPGAEPKNKPIDFYSSNYGYVPFKQSAKDIQTLKYRLSMNLIPYMACYGNKTIRNEMQKGEMTTTIGRSEATGGHAFIAVGVDADYVHFINSWKPNNGSISEFKIKINTLIKAIKKGMFYWRYRITYDVEDFATTQVPLFPDYSANEDSEECKAVEWAKKKGLIKGVKHSDGRQYLEPHRPLTRLEMLLLLYRQRGL